MKNTSSHSIRYYLEHFLYTVLSKEILPDPDRQVHLGLGIGSLPYTFTYLVDIVMVNHFGMNEWQVRYDKARSNI